MRACVRARAYVGGRSRMPMTFHLPASVTYGLDRSSSFQKYKCVVTLYRVSYFPSQLQFSARGGEAKHQKGSLKESRFFGNAKNVDGTLENKRDRLLVFSFARSRNAGYYERRKRIIISESSFTSCGVFLSPRTNSSFKSFE